MASFLSTILHKVAKTGHCGTVVAASTLRLVISKCVRLVGCASVGGNTLRHTRYCAAVRIRDTEAGGLLQPQRSSVTNERNSKLANLSYQRGRNFPRLWRQHPKICVPKHVCSADASCGLKDVVYLYHCMCVSSASKAMAEVAPSLQERILETPPRHSMAASVNCFFDGVDEEL